ncbi:MAG: heme-binding protein [Saprospiraceae bacterium]|nr:MAG: heme-binding protein [Saprospiraceae bacterium]
MVKRIIYIILALLVIIQLFRIDKTNPPVDASQDFVQLTSPPTEIAQLLKSVCYDCHSHETVYPWYTNVAPVSWWIKDHIDHGRKHLNFSVWGTYEPKKADHKLEECYEMVEAKDMPLNSYTWVHGNARLTDAQREQLVTWFKGLR